MKLALYILPLTMFACGLDPNGPDPTDSGSDAELAEPVELVEVQSEPEPEPEDPCAGKEAIAWAIGLKSVVSDMAKVHGYDKAAGIAVKWINTKGVSAVYFTRGVYMASLDFPFPEGGESSWMITMKCQEDAGGALQWEVDTSSWRRGAAWRPKF